jgi:hypothetical protein
MIGDTSETSPPPSSSLPSGLGLQQLLVQIDEARASLIALLDVRREQTELIGLRQSNAAAIEREKQEHRTWLAVEAGRLRDERAEIDKLKTDAASLHEEAKATLARAEARETDAAALLEKFNRILASVTAPVKS